MENPAVNAANREQRKQEQLAAGAAAGMVEVRLPSMRHWPLNQMNCPQYAADPMNIGKKKVVGMIPLPGLTRVELTGLLVWSANYVANGMTWERSMEIANDFWDDREAEIQKRMREEAGGDGEPAADEATPHETPAEADGGEKPNGGLILTTE